MKRLKHRIEYAIVRVFDAALRALPASVAYAVGEAIGALAGRLIGRRRRLVLENLARALPERGHAERQRIADRVWRNLGRTAVEFVRSGEILARWKTDVDFVNGEIVERALKSGTGIVFVTSHFTNWELQGIFAQARFGHLMAVARPMKNPWVEAWVQAKRTAAGSRVVLHRQAVKATLRWVKEGHAVGILADHNLYQGGIFVPFFRRPASSTTLPALLHLRTGAPIIHSYLLRDGRRYKLFFEELAVPETAGDPVQAITAAVAARLEELVRAYPENWFWVHNRWKRQPEAVAP